MRFARVVLTGWAAVEKERALFEKAQAGREGPAQAGLVQRQQSLGFAACMVV